MTPKRLQRIGVRLFGRRWQSTMARHLGTTPRTVRRWAAGDAPVPEWASRFLWQMLAGDQRETISRRHRDLAQQARMAADAIAGASRLFGQARVELGYDLVGLLRDLAQALVPVVASPPCDPDTPSLQSPSAPPPAAPARPRRRQLST